MQVLQDLGDNDGVARLTRLCSIVQVLSECIAQDGHAGEVGVDEREGRDDQAKSSEGSGELLAESGRVRVDRRLRSLSIISERRRLAGI